MRLYRLFTAALLPATFALSTYASASVQYEVIQIGNLPGYENGLPMAINSQNRVLGNSFTDSVSGAWLYSEDTGMTGFGFAYSQFYMRDMNNNNISAGFGNLWNSASRGEPGQMFGWGVLNGYARSEAWGLNDHGDMVGWLSTAGGLQRAARFHAGFTTSELPTLDPAKDSRARRVNSAGTAVGESDDRAVLWTSNDTLVNLHAMIDGAEMSFAADINDAGWVTGYYQDSQGFAKGFRFNFETGMSFFDPLEGDSFIMSRAMNIFGHTVGVSRRTENVGQIEAFLNLGGSQSVSLNSLIDPNSGWFLSEATDINDNGYIIGRGSFMGVNANYMLKPVPEPATLAALGLGLVAVLRKRRKR